MNPEPTPKVSRRRSLVDNTNTAMTKYLTGKDRTTLTLSFRPSDAEALRQLVRSIRLQKAEGTPLQPPSMSLLARRALDVYRSHLTRPGVLAFETEALQRMSMPKPKRKWVPGLYGSNT